MALWAWCSGQALAEPLSDAMWLVRAGDTVANIAQRLYPHDPDQRARLQEALIEANPQRFLDVDEPQHLRPGDRLVIPEFARARARGLIEPRATAQSPPPPEAPQTPFLLSGEWSGSLTPELQTFFQDPDLGPHYSVDLSIAFEPQYYLSWDDGDQAFVIKSFARLDQRDSRRTHFDLRELNWLKISGDWEWLVGIGKVFWGVTEFVHLVDIINQTDQVENIDGEDKLGQPMVKLAWLRDWGGMEFYALPYFRERTFAGRGARLRPALVVDKKRTQYESGAEQHHLDLAARISGTIGLVDFGLSQFIGTAREPEFLLGSDGRGRPALIPRYNQIRQTGLELQAIVGDWLWKLEALRQENPAEDFFAAIGGFEYTLFGVFETAADIGVISEYSYDGRDERLVAPFQNDLFLGLRLTLNDAQSTQLLAGGSVDLDNRARTLRIEAARRFGDHWKLDLELQTFSNLSEKDPLFDLEHDGFVRFDFGYFF